LPTGWRDIDSDPNARSNVLARADALSRAYGIESRTREEIIIDLCRGKSVVDIGCVDHEASKITEERWLHGKILKVASACLGIDNDAPGIDAMRKQGFNVQLADITGDLSSIKAQGPFDVLVAGEVIEHLGNPQSLLVAARELLQPDGKLILTTPNPFAPWRAFAGMRRQVWENVDHVTLLFPSGMVELAERCGMRVTLVTTVGGKRLFMGFPGNLRVLLGMWARALLRRPKGSGPFGIAYPAGYVSPFVAYYIRRLAPLGQLNETSVYVLEPNP
jgi:2-polyprenyl-3-methyl-5-hydroxy-6-metoxy-1,4-benzoquinol methylase